MGLEVNFYRGSEAGEEGISLATLQVDLFEAPDALKFLGACGGTDEGLQEAGFLPSFVIAFRDRFGSQLQGILADEEKDDDEDDESDGADDDDPFFNEMMAHMEAGGCPADFLPEPLEVPVEAGEVAEWADLWLRILESEAFQDATTRQAVLPYNHENLDNVLAELRTLSGHARQAESENAPLRMNAILD